LSVERRFGRLFLAPPPPPRGYLPSNFAAFRRHGKLKDSEKILMATYDSRIARMQKSLRWFGERRSSPEYARKRTVERTAGIGAQIRRCGN